MPVGKIGLLLSNVRLAVIEQFCYNFLKKKTLKDFKHKEIKKIKGLVNEIYIN